MSIFIILLFSEKIVNILVGEAFIQTKWILNVLSPVILIGGLSSILGAHVLVPFGYYKEFALTLFVISLLGIPFIIVSTKIQRIFGAAISIVAIESLILVTFILLISKNKLVIHQKNR